MTRRHVRRFATVFFIAFVLCVQRTEGAQTTEAHDFVLANIHGLILAKDARLLLRGISQEMSGEIVADSMMAMTETRLAIFQLAEAQRRVGRFSNSDDEALRIAAGAVGETYNTISNLMTVSLGIWEKLISAKNEDELATLTAHGSQNLANREIAWGMVQDITEMSLIAIGDHDRRENGKTPLKITDAERQTLIALLEDQFGVGVRDLRAGTYAPEFAAATWWLFLTTR
jgi:hypothetical protein